MNRYNTKIRKYEEKNLAFKAEKEDLKSELDVFKKLCAKLEAEIAEKGEEMDQQRG